MSFDLDSSEDDVSDDGVEDESIEEEHTAASTDQVATAEERTATSEEDPVDTSMDSATTAGGAYPQTSTFADQLPLLIDPAPEEAPPLLPADTLPVESAAARVADADATAAAPPPDGTAALDGTAAPDEAPGTCVAPGTSAIPLASAAPDTIVLTGEEEEALATLCDDDLESLEAMMADGDAAPDGGAAADVDAAPGAAAVLKAAAPDASTSAAAAASRTSAPPSPSYLECGINGCILVENHAGSCLFAFVEGPRAARGRRAPSPPPLPAVPRVPRPPPKPRLPPGAPEHFESRAGHVEEDVWEVRMCMRSMPAHVHTRIALTKEHRPPTTDH